MPGGAVVAAALTDHSARPYSLLVNGLDVIRTSVPVESIRLVEAGPGSVSLLSFEYEDPSAAATVPDGAEVQLLDLANNVPLFRGYPDVVKSRPAFATGRSIEVTCVGVESWLDWLVLPADFTPGPTPVQLQAEIAELVNGMGSPLRAVVSATGFSNQAGPLAFQFNDAAVGTAGWGLGFGSSLGYTVPAGTTLRETIRNLITQADYQGPPGAGFPAIRPLVECTVDFTFGLRLWGSQWWDGSAHAPDDYGTLTVTDTSAGAIASAELNYQVERGDAIHEVYVKGSTAAASGWFADGSGLRTRQGYLSDPTNITSAALAAQAGAAFLRTHGAGLRGTLKIEEVAPSAVATVRAGSLLNLTDAPAGASGTAPIYQITKTFYSSGRQDWIVAFGGLRPSAARLARVLTRDTTIYRRTL